MQAKTKFQKEVISLSEGLKDLTRAQVEYAFKNCLLHLGYRNKTGISCMDCGHRWSGAKVEKECKCPSCGVKLTIEDTRKKGFSQRQFVGKIETDGKYQINRFFEIRSHHKAGQELERQIWEITQNFILPTGKFELVSRVRSTNFFGGDCFNGELEIRSFTSKYNIWTNGMFFPKMSCLPIYERNGFKNDFHGLTALEMFTTIGTDSIGETLLKAGQYQLLDARATGRKDSITKHWNSLKIAIRNNIIIENPKDYLDYLDLLFVLGKDMRSPKYLFPDNLKEAHDKCVAKRRAIQKQLDRIEALKRIEADQQAYYEAKKAFFGICFTDENLTVKVLETVKEFLDEGDAHHHCVFTNEYYKKPDSLILSAQMDGKLLETVEISLSTMKIVQSRGIGNIGSPYSQKVRNLVSKNIGVIRKQFKSSKIVAA